MNQREEFERFGLILNDCVVRTPVAIASMAGMVDADYVLARAGHIGAAFIGGYSVDRRTMDASQELSRQGRAEFLYEDPVGELGRQIARMKGSDVVLGINLRGSTPASYAAIAESFGDCVIYEIDAHCRQQPLLDAGCGEYLLKNPGELEEIIRTLKGLDVQVSVKMRVGVSADDRLLARKCWRAGADILHIDLMDSGAAKIRQIRNSCPVMLIANNGIHTFEQMKEMFSHGADLVSLARRSDERTLSGLDAAITRYSDEHGWYNSPKQLCRGGDIRSLAFCCMPVKSCPLIPTLEKIGMSREEYIQLKQESVRGSPLEQGKQTCFGSLAWCCKDSSPCMFRDMTIRQTGMTNKEYMHLKQSSPGRLCIIFSMKANLMTHAEQAQLAMMLEVTAFPKPGNVDRCHDYETTRLEHFLASTILVRPAFEHAEQRTGRIGERIREAVSLTSTHSGGNTHFGAFILLIPLIMGENIPGALHVIGRTTVEDAIAFYLAFQETEVRILPGDEIDVNSPDALATLRERGMTLRDVMSHSATNDMVAREWITGFPLTRRGADLLISRGPGRESIVYAFLSLLASEPDTFVMKKWGKEVALRTMVHAREVLGGTRDITSFDEDCIASGVNPGSIADIIIASIYIALGEGWQWDC